MSDWLERRRRAEVTRRAEVMRLPVLAARFRAALAAGDGEVRVCASVGPHGQVVALWSATADQAALTPATVQPGLIAHIFARLPSGCVPAGRKS